MSRRKSDKTKDRVLILLSILTVLPTIMASLIGYRAIRALDGFDGFIEAAANKIDSKHIPEAY